MRKRTWELSLFGVCAIVLAGCMTTSTSAPTPAPPVSPPDRQIDEGYSLLYKLMSDESNVDKLLIIKHADKPVHDLVKEIAQFGRDAKKQLDDFKKGDPALVFDAAGLPAVEQEARDQTSKFDAKQLLTSSGKTFELRLIFTQTQAMGYGTDLASALATHEQDAARKAFLQSVSQRCGTYRDRLLEALQVK